MTISSEIVRIKTAIADAYTACQGMGATMPAVLNSDNLEQCIASITGGGGSATTLHKYDRVDGKATVADFWTDGNGQRYAVCVVDAQYRSGSGMQAGKASVNTILPDYSTEQTALAAGESGTYNTDTILNNYSSTDYVAFDFAHNACTVTVDGQSFASCLPNIKELNLIYTDKATLDTYDSTLSSYSARSLTEFKFGSEYGAWSSTEDATHFWLIFYDGALNNSFNKQSSQFGVCPIIEIPVDENGEVQ